MAAALVTLALISAPALDRHLRAAGVLLRFGEAQGTWLADYRREIVTTEESRVGGLTMRSYRPPGEPRGHLLLAHGMHPLGFDEPRMVSLARALAGAGLSVHTPDQPLLKSLSLDARTSDQLARYARALSEREGIPAVGVMAISFAGGFALTAAAADPAAFAFVVPIGAHHDLRRVVRWFAGAEASAPSGPAVSYPPHRYGVGLLVHGASEHFFAPDESDRAHAALDHALRGENAEAGTLIATLSEEAQSILTEARHPNHPTTLAPRILSLLRDEESAFLAASPTGRLSQLPVDVMILHGAEDPIIPPTEAVHLANELPGEPRLLISAALRHAETADTTTSEQLALVHFLAAVLEAAE